MSTFSLHLGSVFSSFPFFLQFLDIFFSPSEPTEWVDSHQDKSRSDNSGSNFPVFAPECF